MRYCGALLSLCLAACGQDPVEGADAAPADTLDTLDVAPADTSDASVTDVGADVTAADTADARDSSPEEASDAAPPDTLDTAAPDAGADADAAPDGVDAIEDGALCSTPDDCTMCAYRARVAGPDDCYCVLCPSFPMTASQCEANRASWAQHCDPWPRPDPCPVASCLPSPRPLCVEGACQRDPNACAWPDDCGACRFAAAPSTAEQCQCPTCPVPLARGHCAEIEEAIASVCTDFDFDGCLPAPCPLPPPIVCMESFTCGYGDLAPPPESR